MGLNPGSSQDLIPAHEVPGALALIVPLRCSEVGEAVKAATSLVGFRQVQFLSREQDGSYAGKKKVEYTYLRGQDDSTLLVRWRQNGRGSSLMEWAAYTQTGGAPPASDPTGNAAFARALEGELRFSMARARPEPLPKDPVVIPGGSPPQRYDGQIRDYSALAHPDTLTAFHRGTLPIGRAAFGWPETPWYGPNLFLPVLGGVPAEQLGVLLCAPQGTGKTHLLLRWAVSAAKAGQSVFLVDIKGNMRGELEAAFARERLQAEIVEFTTAPHGVSDRMNLMAGISVDQLDCTEQLLKLAEALMPTDNFKGRGEEEARHQIAIRMLLGGMQLLKLIEWHGMMKGGKPVDLADLRDLLGSENEVIKWIVAIRKQEEWRRNTGQPQSRYRVDECLLALAIALRRPMSYSAADGKIVPDEIVDGQRPLEYSYLQYLIPVITALDPFRSSGFMADRVRSVGSGREIRLDQLGRDGRGVVVLLTAREQDSSLATAVLGMAMRRLRHALDERRNLPRAATGEILLLLDETRRIPGFDAQEFVSVVRQNRVGYVLVYQALSMAGEEKDLSALLANIGTQVYLKGLRGDDLDQFNRQMAGRDRLRQLETRQPSPSGGQGRGTSQSSTEVPFLQPIAAYPLPGGRRPALIYLRESAAPFLVELDDAM